ncbi:MAG TPA: thiamine pyrophosphate-dependent enzyme [Kofleriaceae bacterium]|nr:thiamine pyrophosphate-dependent enzyme [Kofleriaceae bacterium]
MSIEGVQELDRGFIEHVRGLPAPGARAPGGERLAALLEAQMQSRHLDFAARALRARNQGFYTIGSAGHEGNAAVAEALRPTDPAFLHYRSGAFFIHRAGQVPGQTPLYDVLLGMAASRDEPIAGGRHKVWGSRPLWIPPQTSTIASHLPKAVGLAFALERGRRLGALPDDAPPADAVVMCSFGDASVNHSTAVGALNAACRIAMHLPVPVLFVCEDNGLGISVKTPPGWIEKAWSNRPNLHYVAADGLDLADAVAGARRAADHVRSTRRPAFLHLRTIRYLAHAGSDVELTYRTRDEIVADYARDPLRRSAELVVAAGAMTADQILERWEAIRAEVAALAEQALNRPRLTDAADVMAPLAPRTPDAVAAEAQRAPEAEARGKFWDGRPPDDGKPVPLAAHINAALGDLLVKYPRLLVFGEDVGRKGGVYGVTKTLDRRAGMARVFDTILDEQTILGLAIGAGHAGLLPVPEIQYLAYLHNAEDQLRGEAASLQFFSQGQFRNPMVIRIAGYGYQKGFGGHFHNDDAVAVLRDIPGIVVASPSRGDDAAALLRTCVAAAAVDGAVCVFLEPIALYSTRDLYDDGDGLWQSPYEAAGAHAPIGRARVHGDGDDLLLVSFANGVPMSLRAARRLQRDSGKRCRVLDLRWLLPLPEEDLMREANRIGRVLVVDETRRSGGVAEGVLAALVDGGYRGRMARVTSKDSFIPLGAAANHVLLSEDEIVDAALRL